jgi:hypothetical protein
MKDTIVIERPRSQLVYLTEPVNTTNEHVDDLTTQYFK